MHLFRYYLLRNTVVTPSAAVGGYLWDVVSPDMAFPVASINGLAGSGYLLLFGKEFDTYR